ncbi:hypothetical protein PGB90_003675 [Kerria lacca]
MHSLLPMAKRSEAGMNENGKSEVAAFIASLSVKSLYFMPIWLVIQHNIIDIIKVQNFNFIHSYFNSFS